MADARTVLVDELVDVLDVELVVVVVVEVLVDVELVELEVSSGVEDVLDDDVVLGALVTVVVVGVN